MLNACSDSQVRLKVGAPLPFEDGSFEVIVADNVFEHIDDPGFVAAEFDRVLVPGGYICARTPNKYGYVALMARAIPRRLQAAALFRAQPDRKVEDVFPTVYKLNTVRDIRAYFPGYELNYYRKRTNPGYHFNNRAMFGVMAMIEHLLPRGLLNSICVFLRKPS